MITKPKGCNDILGREAKVWKYVDKVIDEVMNRYNYSYIRTPIFEQTELFHRGVGDTTDIVRKETYDFIDRGNRKMTLRPEGTAGVVRSFIENKLYGEANQPFKCYYNGTMYRYERPQSGRDRELTQFGVEVIGSDDPLIDAEVISLAVNIYLLLGLKEITVNINSLGDNDSRESYRKALTDHFKPHINELCEDCKNRLEKNPLRILDCKVDQDKEIMKKAPKTIDYLNEESKKRFDQVLEYLSILQIEYKVNPNIVRGLDYYNHTVFEVEASVKGMGAQNVIGAGGRYNGLVEALGGPTTPGIGFASGIGRLIMALEHEEVEIPMNESVDLFIMYVNEDEKKYAAYLTQDLRLNGFVVETEYLGRSLKAQFKQADRLNSKFTVVLNSEELNNHQVTIKNNKTKEEETVDLDYLIYFLDEHLEDECDCGHDHEEDCECGHHHE